jgi:hypothetical protein
VRIWRGSRRARTASASTCAARAALSTVSWSSAAIVDVPGRLMPIASIAADIVLAVYMPPHDPAPGQARRSISSSSPASIRPAPQAPTASKTLTIVRSRPA